MYLSVIFSFWSSSIFISGGGGTYNGYISLLSWVLTKTWTSVNSICSPVELGDWWCSVGPSSVRKISSSSPFCESSSAILSALWIPIGRWVLKPLSWASSDIFSSSFREILKAISLPVSFTSFSSNFGT